MNVARRRARRTGHPGLFSELAEWVVAVSPLQCPQLHGRELAVSLSPISPMSPIGRIRSIAPTCRARG